MDTFEASSGDEFQLADMQKLAILASFELLWNHVIWIADTWAYNHGTNSNTGCTNEKATESTSLGATGEDFPVDYEVYIPSTVCNRYSDEWSKVKMTKIGYKSQGNFNIFSVSRCLMEGWKLEGIDTGIELRKDDTVIRFDIIIKTKKGVLFCVLMKRH